MPTEVAAAFPLAAQTSYSMIRKLNPAPGENILDTAAKSNTSLFAINALKKYDVNVYAVSTSTQFKEQLQQMDLIALSPLSLIFIWEKLLIPLPLKDAM